METVTGTSTPKDCSGRSAGGALAPAPGLLPVSETIRYRTGLEAGDKAVMIPQGLEAAGTVENEISEVNMNFRASCPIKKNLPDFHLRVLIEGGLLRIIMYQTLGTKSVAATSGPTYIVCES